MMLTWGILKSHEVPSSLPSRKAGGDKDAPSLCCESFTIRPVQMALSQ